MQMMLIVLTILLPVVCGALLPRFLANGKLKLGVAIALCAELILVECVAFLPDMGFRPVWTLADGLVIGFMVDASSKLFSCLFAAIWLLAGVFAFDYLSGGHAQPRFFRYYLLAQGALAGLCYAGSLITYLILFEAMTFTSLPLVMHEGTPGARKAGLIYLGYSLLGACMVLFGLFMLGGYGAGGAFATGGALSAQVLEDKQLPVALFFVMALGFGAKAGLIPLHAWLPVAHPEAPSPASAVLSGVITKAGVLGILRLTYGLFGPALLQGSWAQRALVILCLCTIFMGSVLAFREPVLKRRLAYSSVSQISYAVLGLMLMTPAGLLGGLLQVVFHAAAKCCLFLWAGAVIHQTGKTQVSELRGIGKQMPASTVCFTVGALSLVGMPPLGGFLSKWFLATGSLAPRFGALGVASACVLILSALLTAGYLLPICARAFSPGAGFEAERREPPRLMLSPMLALAAALILLGLFSAPLTNVILSIGSGLM